MTKTLINFTKVKVFSLVTGDGLYDQNTALCQKQTLDIISITYHPVTPPINSWVATLYFSAEGPDSCPKSVRHHGCFLASSARSSDSNFPSKFPWLAAAISASSSRDDTRAASRVSCSQRDWVTHECIKYWTFSRQILKSLLVPKAKKKQKNLGYRSKADILTASRSSRFVPSCLSLT